MDSKKVIAQEIGRTRARLQKMGVDTRGLSFRYREDDVKSQEQPKEAEQSSEESENDEQREAWRVNDEFVKLFTSDLVDLLDDLTGTEALILFAVMPYISYETGMLTVGKTNNKRPLNNDDIQRIIKKSDTTVTNIMDKLVTKRIVSRNKVGRSYQYFVNPYIFFKGRYINNTLKAMFKKYVEEKSR